MVPKNKVQIKMLGQFAIVIDDVNVISDLSKSKKGMQLLQLLILHEGVSVPSYRLYELLWPNDESSKPENALKTLISRLRITFAKQSPLLSQCIVTERGSYRFSTELGIEVDLFEFAELCNKLTALKKMSEQQRPLIDRILQLYRGVLWVESGNQDSWVISQRIRVHSCFLAVIYRWIEYLESCKAYENIIYICRNVLQIDDLDEKMQLTLMNAMIKLGRVNEALMQHKHVTEMYYRNLGISPTDAIIEFYKKIINSDKSLDESINHIMNDLMLQSKTTGGFICEYGIFKEIYYLQVRNSERTNSIVFLIVVRLSSVDGKPIEPFRANDMMNSLLNMISASVRKGDVISRFGASKVALLLSMENESGGDLVMDRIKKLFYTKYPRSNVVLDYRVSSLHDEKASGR